MNIDLDIFTILLFLVTITCLAVTTVLRPRVLRMFEWPSWLRTSFLILFLVQSTLAQATITGTLKTLAIPLGLLPFCAFLWIAIMRVWLRRAPTDRWLFHVPPVPDSAQREHQTEL